VGDLLAPHQPPAGQTRKNALTRALQEYGRLEKTIFLLRYAESEDLRRRIGRQLNKGEELHALRRFLFFANEGHIRKRQPEEQTEQALCLNLLTDAVILWNTVRYGEILEGQRAEGFPVNDEDLVHLSPTRYGHVNPYGRYRFDLDDNAPGSEVLSPRSRPDRSRWHRQLRVKDYEDR
jgi:hypothetical protein